MTESNEYDIKDIKYQIEACSETEEFCEIYDTWREAKKKYCNFILFGEYDNMYLTEIIYNKEDKEILAYRETIEYWQRSEETSESDIINDRVGKNFKMKK